MLPDSRRWNHNIQYHRLVLREIPPTARTALDVGCGEGMLCRAMRERVPEVVGVDVDPESIALAKGAGGDVRYVLGDFLSDGFAEGPFDFIASVATLHQVDVEHALCRMRDLLHPQGRLALVGLARRTANDVPLDTLGFVAHRVLKLRHGYWEHPSPTAEPTMTHCELRKLVADVLPGARYRQHVLFRYSLTWTKPNRDVP